MENVNVQKILHISIPAVHVIRGRGYISNEIALKIDMIISSHGASHLLLYLFMAGIIIPLNFAIISVVRVGAAITLVSRVIYCPGYVKTN